MPTPWSAPRPAKPRLGPLINVGALIDLSGRRGSNSLPTAWEAVALPGELLPLLFFWEAIVSPEARILPVSWFQITKQVLIFNFQFQAAAKPAISDRHDPLFLQFILGLHKIIKIECV